MTEPFPSLQFSDTFLEAFAGRSFGAADRAAIIKALRLLDQDERHRSLRLHQLEGTMAGMWSASATRSLRITFERLENGQKLLHECTKHYDR